jgi:hypothetical protein
METDGVPAEASALLRAHIESYEHLVALLWLRKHHQEAWTPHAIGAGARIPDTSVHSTLEHLLKHHLVEVQADSTGSRYIYNPRPASLAAAVEALEIVHERSVLEIVKILNANAFDRIRNAAIHTFADAFVLGSRRRNG